MGQWVGTASEGFEDADGACADKLVRPHLRARSGTKWFREPTILWRRRSRDFDQASTTSLAIKPFHWVAPIWGITAKGNGQDTLQDVLRKGAAWTDDVFY